MSDDLVKRLRNRVEYYQIGPKQVRVGDELAEEAADRIEALIAAGDKLNEVACHTDDCEIVTHGVWSDPIPCTCGYTEAWKAWQEVRGDV